MSESTQRLSRPRDASARPPRRDRLLIVDDSWDAREMYALYFRSHGYDVRTAPDGDAGIESAVKSRPDVIVMDLAMPRVDGWEAIRRLCESSWTREIPVIAVSAVPVSRETAFNAGCKAYLTKPCEPHVLWAQIRVLLKLPQTTPSAFN